MSVASAEPIPTTGDADAVGPLPPLRLLVAPCAEPPFDDELPSGGHAPALAPRLRLVRAPRCLPGDEERAEVPASGGAGGGPPSRPFARAFVQRLLEVLAGLRPLSQLQRDTSLEVYAALEQVLAERTRPSGMRRPTPRDVRSVHVQERPEGVAEVCATVVRGPRVRALALRLERSGDGWRCCELLGV